MTPKRRFCKEGQMLRVLQAAEGWDECLPSEGNHKEVLPRETGWWCWHHADARLGPRDLDGSDISASKERLT
eukprot:5490461-Amphidinium_carterae.1